MRISTASNVIWVLWSTILLYGQGFQRNNQFIKPDTLSYLASRCFSQQTRLHPFHHIPSDFSSCNLYIHSNTYTASPSAGAWPLLSSRSGSLSDDSSSEDEDVKNPFKSYKSVTFVSSNPYKIKEVKLILGEDFPWSVHCEALDLSEPQANAIEISIAKCQQAATMCDGPVIVEDTSLCFNALGGLPGPYIKWFFEGIGNDGLAKLLDGFTDKSAFAQCVVSFTLGKGHDIKTFVGSTDGTIVFPTGPQGFGWDPIFQPLGSDKTFAQMDRSEKNKISHRFKAFREFKAYINSRTAM